MDCLNLVSVACIFAYEPNFCELHDNSVFILKTTSDNLGISVTAAATRSVSGAFASAVR